MIFHGITDVGQMRNNNQDSFRVCRLENGALLAVVCDGMGGAAGGSLASSAACEAFCDFVLQNEKVLIDADGNLKDKTAKSALISAANKANTAVYKKTLLDSSLAGMGTTLVACLIYKDILMAVNIGDSRIYSISSDIAHRISKDHSYVQALVDEGEITEEEAFSHPKKNIILRAVGIDDSVESDFFVYNADMDYVLLCSDGLTNYIKDNKLGEFFKDGSLEEKVKALVDFANASGGSDNITAVVIDLKSKGGKA